jgi:hypothetical protein
MLLSSKNRELHQFYDEYFLTKCRLFKMLLYNVNQCSKSLTLYAPLLYMLLNKIIKIRFIHQKYNYVYIHRKLNNINDLKR